MPKRLTETEARQRIADAGWDVEILEPYPRSVTRHWRMIHKPCGREITNTVNRASRGLGCCKYCQPNRPITHEEALGRIRQYGWDVTVLEPYPGMANSWKMIHHDCGKEITTKLVHGHAGAGPCIHCSGRRLLTDDEARDRARSAGWDVDFLEPYPGMTNLWRMRHKPCGRIIETRLANSISGRSCCLKCSQIGATNMKTLGRHAHWRWSVCHLYVRQMGEAGKPVYKIGIGTLERAGAGPGEVVHVVRSFRGIAFLAEQQILTRSEPVEISTQLVNHGRTEVVSSLAEVPPAIEWLEQVTLRATSSDHERDILDRELFPDATDRLGDDMSCSEIDHEASTAATVN